MPITKSAKKESRSSEKKKVFNVRCLRKMRLAVKGFQKSVKSNTSAKVKEMLPEIQKTIDKAVKRGVIKPNTGARKKSRLMKLLKNKEE